VHGIVLVRVQAMTDVLDVRIGDLLISQHEGAPEEGNRVMWPLCKGECGGWVVK
jgi:hypothetical protein